MSKQLKDLLQQDIERRVLAFRFKLEKKVREAKARAKHREFRKTINAIFDQYPAGQVIVLPALVALTLRDMNVTPADYAVYCKAAKNYIRRQNWLMITKGKSGGVRRLKDQKKKT